MPLFCFARLSILLEFIYTSNQIESIRCKVFFLLARAVISFLDFMSHRLRRHPHHRMGDLFRSLQTTADGWTFVGRTPEKGELLMAYRVVVPVLALCVCWRRARPGAQALHAAAAAAARCGAAETARADPPPWRAAVPHRRSARPTAPP